MNSLSLLDRLPELILFVGTAAFVAAYFKSQITKKTVDNLKDLAETLEKRVRALEDEKETLRGRVEHLEQENEVLRDLLDGAKENKELARAVNSNHSEVVALFNETLTKIDALKN